jgi:NAD(P)-dependent dehydrogenase (short-subunit alcohol dehydrogenase family)
MKNFRDKVAVITGAASGIGRALAVHCVREGMRVVLADIEEAALAQVGRELQSAGGAVLDVRTDVSCAGDVELLARKTLEAYGAVHLLFNNAGVSAGTTLWESTPADWEWVMGVNLWGVIHGARTFVPIMLAQNTACHIINTASINGLLSGVVNGIYHVTKHGIVTLSETLYQELQRRGAQIRVSVLCPAGVNTRIIDSNRNRPAHLQNKPAPELSPEAAARMQAAHAAMEREMPPRQVAEKVFAAIREEKFYILTHPEWKDAVRTRMEDILLERNPSPTIKP